MRPVLAFLLIGWAGQASSHGTLSGGGNFYSGVVHPFVAFGHLLALLTLGLLVGQLRDRTIGFAALALLVGLLVGALSQSLFQADFSMALFGFALISGFVLAASPTIPAGIFIAAAAATGWLVGADTDVLSSTDATLASRALAAAGLMTGAQMITLNLAALSRYLRHQGWGILPRVAGSWIAAIAMLVLTLTLSGVSSARTGAIQ